MFVQVPADAELDADEEHDANEEFASCRLTSVGASPKWNPKWNPEFEENVTDCKVRVAGNLFSALLAVVHARGSVDKSCDGVGGGCTW